MTDCTHSNLEFEGERSDNTGGNWKLIRVYTCRQCHTHFSRAYEMTVSPNYLEREIIHGNGDRLTIKNIRAGTGS